MLYVANCIGTDCDALVISWRITSHSWQSVPVYMVSLKRLRESSRSVASISRMEAVSVKVAQVNAASISERRLGIRDFWLAESDILKPMLDPCCCPPFLTILSHNPILDTNMSDPESSPQAIQEAHRKRKRSFANDDHRQARSHPASSDVDLHASQDARGVFVDIPAPSSSAMAAFHAAQQPLSSQLDSQFSIDMDDTPLPSPSVPHQSSASEYVPSTQADHSNSSASAAAPASDVAILKPLPTISTRIFEPYIDDTTGVSLDQAEARISRSVVVEQPDSSPVESFSPAEQVRPQDIPRLGAWVLPPLTEENSNPRVHDYSGREVLSQIPIAFDDEDELVRELAASQSSQPVLSRQRRKVVEPSVSPVVPPVESTPALATAHVQEEGLPTSQPIPSPPQEAVSSRPALPPPTAREAPSTASSSSSLGWSTLPRPEVVELVHRSPHIPAFLKDEIERFLLRAHRSSSPSRSPQHGRGSRRLTSQSQSQSQSGNDDSETQEDGFLRTKKLWCMDLLLLPSSSSPSVAGLSEVVQRLTQLSQSSESARAGVAVILLLDMVKATWDVHELDEALARVLREDRRYSVLYDGEGRRWSAPAATAAAPASPAIAVEGEGDELETARSEIVQLQTRLDSAQSQIETLLSTTTTLERELTESRSQHDFIRDLYDRASLSATTAQTAASTAQSRITLLESQLSEGLALHRTMLDTAIDRWKTRIKKLEAERAFMVRQAELTDAGEVRRKAGLWDAYRAEEEVTERERKERIRKHDEKQRLREAAQGDGLGPFARPTIPARGTSPDEMDELAALAREAAEAGDILPTPPEGGRSRRSRRAPAPATPAEESNLSLRTAANRPPPSTAEEMAAQVEAAQFSSANAASDSRLELEDQFAVFQPSSTVEQVESVAGMGDFDLAPSTGVDENALFGATYVPSDQEAAVGGEGGWGESLGEVQLPPSFTEESLLLNGDPAGGSVGRQSGEGEGEGEGVLSFEPHTQA